MVEYGSGELEDILSGLYNFYEVTCITEDVKAIPENIFKYLVRDNYFLFMKANDNKSTAIQIHVNKTIDNKSLLWVEIRYDENNDVGIYLVRNPEV